MSFSIELTLNGLTVPKVRIEGRAWQDIQARLPIALLAAATYIAGQIRLNLSGISNSRFDVWNKYPGTISGRLKGSFSAGQAFHRHTVSPSRVWWGSLVKYAAIHEHGGYIFITDRMRGWMHSHGFHPKRVTLFVHIPPRPYVKPAVDRSRTMSARIIKMTLLKKAVLGGK